MEVKEYLARDGRSPFHRWFDEQNAKAAAKITVAIARMQNGNLSNVHSVGQGVHEYVIDFGPGYRVYLGRDGEEIIILLGGGSKKKQSEDIARAKWRWTDYKQRKKRGT